jgi:hypothetical protein
MPAQYVQIPVASLRRWKILSHIRLKKQEEGEDTKREHNQRKESEERKKRKSEEFNELSGDRCLCLLAGYCVFFIFMMS